MRAAKASRKMIGIVSEAGGTPKAWPNAFDATTTAAVRIKKKPNSKIFISFDLLLTT
jgi:hypothetical protein